MASTKDANRRKNHENIDVIRKVLQQLHDQDVNVDQFVAIIGLHTADRGVALTQVMTEDLNSFRKMVDTVYETMTQDISDVLANEQMELAKMYEEKHKTIVDKIMTDCKKLKSLYPPFNFEDYYDDPDHYVSQAFTVPEIPEDEEFDMVKRHLAFHRLQWIYSEGQRLKAENHKLQNKLTEMKQNQRRCLKEAVKREVEAEQVHLKLSRAERALQTKLAELNESIQESFVPTAGYRKNDAGRPEKARDKRRKEKCRPDRISNPRSAPTATPTATPTKSHSSDLFSDKFDVDNTSLNKTKKS